MRARFCEIKKIGLVVDESFDYLGSEAEKVVNSFCQENDRQEVSVIV